MLTDDTVEQKIKLLYVILIQIYTYYTVYTSAIVNRHSMWVAFVNVLAHFSYKAQP